jgi:hypothetical protein
LTIAFIDDFGCYDDRIDRVEFHNDPVEITTVTPDDVTGDPSADVKRRNTKAIDRLKERYNGNLGDRLLYLEEICIRHLIERLNDCHRELSNLAEKGSFCLNHSTHILTRPQAFLKSAKMFER